MHANTCILTALRKIALMRISPFPKGCPLLPSIYGIIVGSLLHSHIIHLKEQFPFLKYCWKKRSHLLSQSGKVRKSVILHSLTDRNILFPFTADRKVIYLRLAFIHKMANAPSYARAIPHMVQRVLLVLVLLWMESVGASIVDRIPNPLPCTLP